MWRFGKSGVQRGHRHSCPFCTPFPVRLLDLRVPKLLILDTLLGKSKSIEYHKIPLGKLERISKPVKSRGCNVSMCFLCGELNPVSEAIRMEMVRTVGRLVTGRLPGFQRAVWETRALRNFRSGHERNSPEIRSQTDGAPQPGFPEQRWVLSPNGRKTEGWLHASRELGRFLWGRDQCEQGEDVGWRSGLEIKVHCETLSQSLGSCTCLSGAAYPGTPPSPPFPESPWHSLYVLLFWALNHRLGFICRINILVSFFYHHIKSSGVPGELFNFFFWNLIIYSILCEVSRAGILTPTFR